jgi:hypothetical protein
VLRRDSWQQLEGAYEDALTAGRTGHYSSALKMGDNCFMDLCVSVVVAREKPVATLRDRQR